MNGGSLKRRIALVAGVAVAAVLATSAFGASRAATVELGVLGDPAKFAAATGQHSHSRLIIIGWGQDRSFQYYFSKLFATMQDEPMLGIGIPDGSALSPRAVANGKGDAFLVRLNHAVAAFGNPIYVRPLAEMNGWWNSYCAYNSNGTRRGAAYSTAVFKKAFARIYLIVHGDPDANVKLAKMRLPKVQGGGTLDPATNVQIIWNPQGFGSPNLAGNSAASYYPGDAYVDVVGDDLYDNGGKAEWPAAEAMYKRFATKPFSFPEWGLTGIDDPSFVKAMANFVKTHGRTQVISYFNSTPGSTWDINTKPSSRAAYRTYITPLGQ